MVLLNCNTQLYTLGLITRENFCISKAPLVFTHAIGQMASKSARLSVLVSKIYFLLFKSNINSKKLSINLN